MRRRYPFFAPWFLYLFAVRMKSVAVGVNPRGKRVGTPGCARSLLVHSRTHLEGAAWAGAWVDCRTTPSEREEKDQEKLQPFDGSC